MASSTQTRRHSYLVSLLGIRRIVLAINKLDLVDYSQATFDEISADYRAYAAQIGLARSRMHSDLGVAWRQHRRAELQHSRGMAARRCWNTSRRFRSAIPTNGTVSLSRAVGEPPEPRLPWRVGNDRQRHRQARRQRARAALGVVSHVSRIATADGDLPEASAGQAVTIVLRRRHRRRPRHVLSAVDRPADLADQFEASIVWMHDEPLHTGRQYDSEVGAGNSSG